MFKGIPLYLSATTHSHPNYAIYLAEKNALTVKAFNELLQSIPDEDKPKFSKDKAEQYYRSFQEKYIDDKSVIDILTKQLTDTNVVILAPGKSLASYPDAIRNKIDDNTVVIAANFLAEDFNPDYVFSSNMRRYIKIQGKTDAKCIITSNMKEAKKYDMVVNFASYASKYADIIDNSVLMLLRLLVATGVKKVMIAGMDGYTESQDIAYYTTELQYDFSKEAKERNTLISKELKDIKSAMELEFITPTIYSI